MLGYIHTETFSKILEICLKKVHCPDKIVLMEPQKTENGGVPSNVAKSAYYKRHWACFVFVKFYINTVVGLRYFGDCF